MKKMTVSILLYLVLLFPLNIYGHSGRTDSQGGHYNRKTGEYHYHNSGSRTSSSGTLNPAAIDRVAASPKPVKTDRTDNDNQSKNYSPKLSH
ncbi:MAG: hypothetical protein A2Y10_04885 [Planctomycetes bacterium GWF2_41_51]|nr:MAG: hypothetical protein A2Y10_04885 [Planctomycetes bacterium GWF2_41_51]